MTRRAQLIPVAVAILLAAAMFQARGHWPWARLSDIPRAEPIVVTGPFRVTEDTLQAGETVSGLLSRQGVSGIDLLSLARKLELDLRQVRPGLVFSVRHDGESDVATQVEFQPGRDERFQFVRTASGDWHAESIPIHWTTDTVRVSAVIESNLYDALDRSIGDATLDAGERIKLSYQLASANEYTLDFSRDLQPGDQVTSVVERQVSEDGDVRFNRVLASRLTVNHKTYEAYDYPDAAGQNAFYDASGAALKRAFLMSPVDFRYISSGFSTHRLHPILGMFRRHEGIDFAASAGSPVRAAGDGVVAFAGRRGGYGNLIELRHRNGITTRYGHLSHIDAGIRPGARVEQGEEIGRVGMTGLATGPHLHYEFRVDGVARDPRTVKSKAGPPLPASELADFEHDRVILDELLGGVPSSAAIAE